MRFKKIMSIALAIGVLLLSLMAFQMFKKTQLVMFESISFNMSLESIEKVFGKPNEIVEETETGYHNPWHAKDPYLYKTGRLFYDYENFKWKGYSGRVTFTFSKSHRLFPFLFFLSLSLSIFHTYFREQTFLFSQSYFLQFLFV